MIIIILKCGVLIGERIEMRVKGLDMGVGEGYGEVDKGDKEETVGSKMKMWGIRVHD